MLKHIVMWKFTDGCGNTKDENVEIARSGLEALPESVPTLKKITFIKNEKFEYAYAVTCHAMQGSSDNRVLYADQRMRDPYYTKKLRYTAITRARESITIVLDDEHSDY